MRQIITRTWHYLEADPGPILSLAVFILAALVLGEILNVLAPGVMP